MSLSPHRRAIALSCLLAASLSAQADWSRVATLTSPGTLSDHVLVYDFRRALLFGGDDGNGATNVFWQFDGKANWTAIQTAQLPPARLRHAGAFDRSRNTFVVFGGSTSLTGGLRQDTWEWNGASWKQLTPATSPSPRNDHAMCYDSKSRRVLLFGGRTASGDAQDTWAWDGTNWTQIMTRTSPPGRRDHGMVFDELRGVAVSYGGFYGSGLSVRSDTWEFDGSDWVQRMPTVRPGNRVGYGLVYDAYRDRTVLFSGYAAPGQPDDTWEWDGVNWTNRGPNNKPTGRSGHAMCYDVLNSRVILFGGWDSALSQETWIYGTAQKAGFQVSGTNCRGSAGAALLALDEGRYPWVGGTLGVECAPLPNGAPVAMLLGFSKGSWGSFTLPLALDAAGATGCTLLASADLLTVATTNAARATWSLPIPNDSSLSGLAFYLQGLVIDPPVNAFGAVFSNLGTATVGRR